jgi:LysM repeat protein
MKITEIDRRGFLRGLGAAGAAAATGGALAKAPVELPITGYYPLSVQSGQTIYSIARNTMTEPKEIMKLNGFDNKTRLEKGQLVKIPQYDKNPDYPLKSKHNAPEPVAQKPVVPDKSIYADPADKGVDHSRKSAEPAKSTEIPKSIAVNNPKSALNEPGFMDKLKDVARKLGLQVNALIGIIGHETIRTFSPSIQAPDKIRKDGTRVPGAVGLIQFTHETARDLGTSTEELKRMSGTQQLDYVYRFLKRSSRPGMDAGDLYMSIFIPAYVGRDPKTVIAKEGGGKLPGTGLNMDQIWRDNPTFGINRHKSYFTIQDVKDSLREFMG